MIPANTCIWIVAGLTDLRRGFVGLSAMVQTALEQNPFNGHVFVFRGKRGDLIKLLWFDGDGLWVCGKRLQSGCFHWPAVSAGEVKVRLTPEEFAMLIGGMDLEASRPLSWYRKEIDEVVAPA